MLTRAEVLDMVAFQCEDNYGEELTPKAVADNWNTLVDALQSEGELPRGYKGITGAEIASVIRRVN